MHVAGADLGLEFGAVGGSSTTQNLSNLMEPLSFYSRTCY